MEPAVQTDRIRDISINALHASVVRAMSSFVQQPTAELAETVLYLLNALAEHPERFVAPCGHDVYPQARTMWRELAGHMRQCLDTRYADTVH